jgi:hypothetical protein
MGAPAGGATVIGLFDCATAPGAVITAPAATAAMSPAANPIRPARTVFTFIISFLSLLRSISDQPAI